MFHLNCDSVIEWSIFDSHTDNEVSNSTSIYRELTKREGNMHIEMLCEHIKINFIHRISST